MRRTGKVLADSLKKNRTALILFAVMTVLNGAVFLLYGLLTEAFVYAEILLFVLLCVLLTADYFSERKKAGVRGYRENNLFTASFEEPDHGSLADRDYTRMLALLRRRIEELQTDFLQKQQADDDYYTAWVHQIKTPIAVMKLELSEDTEQNRALLSELFRIEQYVGLVLDYVRLRSETNDLVIREYSLDAIIKDALRAYAQQFVLRRLRLNYTPTQASVVTDRKWLTFILEQFVSNAIKYTPAGEITITADGRRIRVSDTGIGIAPEDLPRIFEKGYTGVNGRLGERSSGLGLFLTKKAADLISAQVQCESTVGKGSTFTVTLPGKAL